MTDTPHAREAQIVTGDPSPAGESPATSRWSRPHHTRLWAVLGVAALIAVLAATAAVVVPRILDGGRPSAGGLATAATAATSAPCAASPEPHLLPVWARGGFSSPEPVIPYVTGDRGSIVGILWSTHDPLRVPPGNPQNKILWVAKTGSGPLTIAARHDGDGHSVRLTVDLGPSIVDLPEPGCWSFSLTWHGGQDHTNLRYVAS